MLLFAVMFWFVVVVVVVFKSNHRNVFRAKARKKQQRMETKANGDGCCSGKCRRKTLFWRKTQEID